MDLSLDSFHFGMFHFLRPAWLLALPPLLALAAWFALRRSRDGAWARLIDPALLPGLRLDGGSGGRGPWPLLGLVWALAVLALAGPAWQRETTPAFRAPNAWVLVLDLSPSMAARDLAPDRVSRARYAIDDLLAAVGDGQVALVAFGDDAYTVTPLTRDVATVKALLPPLSPDILPAAGDHLAPALDVAAGLLQRAGATHGQVVVLTDGFDDPAAAFAAAGRLRSQGARLRVVSVGTRAGAPVPNADGSFGTDGKGATPLARLDPDRLRQLAASGGGDLTPLDALPDLIGRLRAAAAHTGGATLQQGVRVARWRDAGIWLLPVLLLGAALMGRRGWL